MLIQNLSSNIVLFTQSHKNRKIGIRTGTQAGELQSNDVFPDNWE